MRLQVLERLGRAIARARQTVGAEAHPCQERYQRNVVIDLLVSQIERSADQERLYFIRNRLLIWRDFVIAKDGMDYRLLVRYIGGQINLGHRRRTGKIWPVRLVMWQM